MDKEQREERRRTLAEIEKSIDQTHVELMAILKSHGLSYEQLVKEYNEIHGKKT